MELSPVPAGFGIRGSLGAERAQRGYGEFISHDWPGVQAELGRAEGAEKVRRSFKTNDQSFILLMTILVLLNGIGNMLMNSCGRRQGTFICGKRGQEEFMPKKSNPPKQLIIFVIWKSYFGELFASSYSKYTI